MVKVGQKGGQLIQRTAKKLKMRMGNIGDPPTEEGTVDEAQQEREDLAFRAKYNFGKRCIKG